MKSFSFGNKMLHISGTPLGSDLWLQKRSGAQTGGKSWKLYVFGIQVLHISGTPLGSYFWLRKRSGAQAGQSIGFWHSDPIHFWHPSRIRFLAPKKLWNPNGRKIIIDRFLVFKSYTFLAPLSDPIFGSDKAPEPKREENHGIDKFVVLKSYTFLAPHVGSE